MVGRLNKVLALEGRQHLDQLFIVSIDADRRKNASNILERSTIKI